MNLIPINSRTGAAALALLTFSAGLPAATPPAAPVDASAKKNEDVVTLSEFSVKAEPDRGYVASETMTGSRVNVKIVDLPYSVVNLTSEFFEDFGVLELGDNVTFIGGFTGLDIGGGFNLRGFSSTSQLRDGFYRLGRYGESNVDRIEIIRGPNAAIYGRSSPGGMVNMISKQPKNTPRQELSFSFGDYKTRREKLESTGPLFQSSLGKTYYVLTLSQFERGFDGGYAHIRNNEYYAAVRHDFTNGGHLQVQAEYFLNYRHSLSASSPGGAQVITDQKGTAALDDDRVIGYDTHLYTFNPFGPNSELNRGSVTFMAAYDQRISDVWSFRLGAQNFRARRWDYNQNTGWGGVTINSPTNAPITSTRGTTPTKGLIQEDGGGFQGDLVAHYPLFGGAIDNKTLLTLDVNDYYRWDPTWNFAPTSNADLVAWNSARIVPLSPVVIDGRTEYLPTAPYAFFPKWFTWGQETLNRLTRRRTTSLGGNFKQQVFAFNGRLIGYAGFRYDEVRFRELDKTTAAFPSYGLPGSNQARRFFHELKPNVGFNYKLDSNLHAYGSYSEGYFVDQTANPNVIANPIFKPETAKGYDYGLKGSYFDERLNFTLGGYYISRYNVSVSDTVLDPTTGGFVNVTRYDGDQLVRGWEAELNWRITSELSFGSSFATVNSKYTNFGSQFPEARGRSVDGKTPENGSAWLKYGFNSGPLKGLSANVMATYVASTPSEGPTSGDTTAVQNGVVVVTRSTEQWKLRVPSYTLWNAGLHYRLRTDRLEHTFGVNLSNAFDKFYLKTSKNLGDRRTVLFTYSIAFAGGH